MKRTVKFKDAKGNVAVIDVELRKEEKGLVFTASGEYCGHLGQCLDSIKPKNDAQKRLIELWEKYHLNDMHAGTEKQENAIKQWEKQGNKYHYEDVCLMLKAIGLYADNGFKYGHGWQYRALPVNIEEEVNTLCNEIERTETELRGDITVKKALDEKLEFDEQETDLSNYSNEVLALAINLDLTIEELEEIDQAGNYLTHGGRDYFVGTEDEGHEEARIYLTDDPYLWQEAVKAGNTTSGLEEWAEEVINIDGVGHLLNRYDGGEKIEEVNGIDYYIYRR